MIRRTLIAAFGAAGLLLALSVSAFAWTGDVGGQPTLTDDSPTGYFIWHNDDGMHLRTHGPGQEHFFTARLVTDGVFEDVDPVRLENVDSYKLEDGGHVLALRFHTYDGIDGVNFRVNGGEWLRFNLRLDGSSIAVDDIYLGADGHHPATNPFTLHR